MYYRERRICHQTIDSLTKHGRTLRSKMNHAIVSTITDRCKRCYSCIRECPASAIRVIDAQAKVIEERCIACGHCVKVCSQDAKQIFSEIDDTYQLLQTGNAIAIVAPSFAASFPDEYKKVPSCNKKTWIYKSY